MNFLNWRFYRDFWLYFFLLFALLNFVNLFDHPLYLLCFFRLSYCRRLNYFLFYRGDFFSLLNYFLYIFLHFYDLLLFIFFIFSCNLWYFCHPKLFRSSTLFKFFSLKYSGSFFFLLNTHSSHCKIISSFIIYLLFIFLRVFFVIILLFIIVLIILRLVRLWQ